MNTPINDGGPAFPNVLPETTAAGGWDSGMTLRDWFAAAALTGIMTNASEGDEPMPHPEILAKAAWVTADAMLAARGQTNP